MISVPRLAFTVMFLVLALWCAFSVLRPQSRFGAVTRMRGRRVESMRTRRVASGVIGIGCLLAALGSWSYTA